MEREIEHRLTTVEDRSKSNQHRLDEVERRQDNLDDLVSTVKVLALREENVEKDVKEIKADVKEINGKPAKRWETLVSLLISGVVGAVLGFIISKIGL